MGASPKDPHLGLARFNRRSACTTEPSDVSSDSRLIELFLSVHAPQFDTIELEGSDLSLPLMRGRSLRWSCSRLTG